MQQSDQSTNNQVHIIVVGNEKGGAGKTTSSMHIIASLLNLGFKVSSIDVDTRQLSLSRYLENRQNTLINKNLNLAMPSHYTIKPSHLSNLDEIQKEEEASFAEILSDAASNSDFIVIDTPGSNSFLSRLAHSYADTIITPINDSFVDLDVLAKVEGDSLKIEKPAIYSQMVWEQKMQRAKRDRGVINWIVMRNRLSTIDAKNKRNVGEVLTSLANRIGFRVAPGFSERVIFRELFLQGLTLLDLKELGESFSMSMSHIAARQELREFLKFLQIRKLDDAINNSAIGKVKEDAIELS
jgi:chromosome partitioning protein